MRRLCIIFAILLTVALGAYKVQELATPVTLSVPSCGIEVDCEHVTDNNSERLQAVAFRFFRELLEKKYGAEEAARRIYATTDRRKGALKSLADAKGYETFVVPDDVGSRYSF